MDDEVDELSEADEMDAGAGTGRRRPPTDELLLGTRGRFKLDMSRRDLSEKVHSDVDGRRPETRGADHADPRKNIQLTAPGTLCGTSAKRALAY